jgi:hypothetical protein
MAGFGDARKIFFGSYNSIEQGLINFPYPKVFQKTGCFESETACFILLTTIVIFYPSKPQSTSKLQHNSQPKSHYHTKNNHFPPIWLLLMQTITTFAPEKYFTQSKKEK